MKSEGLLSWLKEQKFGHIETDPSEETIAFQAGAKAFRDLVVKYVEEN